MHSFANAFSALGLSLPTIAAPAIWDPSTEDHTSLWLVADDAVNGGSGPTYPSFACVARDVLGSCDAPVGSSGSHITFTQHSGHGNTVYRSAAPLIDGHYALCVDAYGAISGKVATVARTRKDFFGPFVSSGAGGGDDVNSLDYSYAMVLRPRASNTAGASSDIGGSIANATILSSPEAGKSGNLTLTLAQDGGASAARVELVHYNAYVGMSRADLDLGAMGSSAPFHLLEVSYTTATQQMLVRLDGVSHTFTVGKVRAYLGDALGPLILGNFSASLMCQFDLAEVMLRNRPVTEAQMIEHETYFHHRYPSLPGLAP